MDLLDRLLEHDRWATGQLLEVSRNLTDEQLVQTFDIGHGTLLATFGHMVFNVEVWTEAIIGEPVQAKRSDDSLAELIERHTYALATFAAVARQMRDEQRLDDTFVDDFGAPMTYGGAMLHVILHEAEHRAEALHILQRLGVSDLPEIDHGLWDFVRRGLYQPGA